MKQWTVRQTDKRHPGHYSRWIGLVSFGFSVDYFGLQWRRPKTMHEANIVLSIGCRSLSSPPVQCLGCIQITSYGKLMHFMQILNTNESANKPQAEAMPLRSACQPASQPVSFFSQLTTQGHIVLFIYLILRLSVVFKQFLLQYRFVSYNEHFFGCFTRNW